PRAQVFKEGVAIAETPEAVKVPAGETLSVVLKKAGFVDEPLVVDPTKGRKVLVKLEKAHKGKAPARTSVRTPIYSQPAPLPKPPPIPAEKPPAPVAAPPPPVEHAPVAKKKRPQDPFERIDDHGTKKTGEVLNPY